MTYRFRGFFANGDQSLFEAAIVKWPGVLGKVIENLFAGYEAQGFNAVQPALENVIVFCPSL